MYISEVICAATGRCPPPSLVVVVLRPGRRLLRPQRPGRPGPGSRPVQGLHRRAERHRDELRRRGRVGPAGLQRHHRHAADARSAFELHGSAQLRADARAAGRPLLRPRHHHQRRSTATSPSSPSSRARPRYQKGLRRGDVIAKIEGEDTKGWTSEQAVRQAARAEGHVRQHLASGARGYDELIDLARHARRDPHPDRARRVHARRARPATSSCRTSARTPTRSSGARCAT